MNSENIPSSIVDNKQIKALMSWNTQKTKHVWNTSDFLDVLSTHFLICTEKIAENGEDCGLESYNQIAGLIGVFDGCGGLGSKICPAADNKTEAYLASRTVGNAVKLWFDYCCDNQRWELNLLECIILKSLECCKKHSQDSAYTVKGSLIKPYPSTMALVVTFMSQGKLLTTHIWAGDSRSFFLDMNGLAQISKDDINGGDALENITQDSALTNIISLGGEFIIHNKTIELHQPTVIIVSTDGCFGYVSSPMEFEYILLSSLFISKNVDEWQRNLQDTFSSLSGDDQTIAIEAIGFETFFSMKEYYSCRYRYIEKVCHFGGEEIDSSVIQVLWNEYKQNYYRFTE